MLLPKQFKETIANTFYDKDVNILSKNSTLDAEGGRTIKGGSVSVTFKGNVRFTNLKEIQQEYGLSYQIDIAITCDPDTAIVVDDIISYNNKKYKITDALPSDSHLLIVAKLWK